MTVYPTGAVYCWSNCNHLPDNVEFNDLISYGIFGLMDAVDKFDLGRILSLKRMLVHPRRDYGWTGRQADSGVHKS